MSSHKNSNKYNNIFNNAVDLEDVSYKSVCPENNNDKITDSENRSIPIKKYSKNSNLDGILKKAVNIWTQNCDKSENYFCDALAYYYYKACNMSSKKQPKYLFKMANILHSRGLLSRKINKPNAWRHYTRAYYIFLKLGIEKPEVYPILTSLAQLFINQEKQYKEAAHLLNQCQKIYRLRYTEKSWVYLNCLTDLLLLHCKDNKWNIAINFAEKAIECHSNSLIKDELSEFRLKKALSNVYEKCGRIENAYLINIDLLKILEHRYGKKHMNVLKHLMDIAKLLESLGKYEKAEEILKQCVDGFEKNFGKNSAQVAIALSSLATLHVTNGKLNEAISQLMKSLNIRLKVFGENHFVIGESYFKIAIINWAFCKYPEAENFMYKALEIYNITLGLHNEITIHAKKMLSEIQQRYSVRIDKSF